MKQSSRLILTVLFLILLLILSRWLTGFWFYWPSGDQSLWFSSGLLMVVLGSFFVEKYFTKPVDVVTNCIVGIITLLGVEHREHFLFWKLTLRCIIALLLAALLSMAIQSFSRNTFLLRVGNWLFSFATFFGSAKRLFSVLLFLSIFSFWSVPSRNSLFIFIFWAIVVCSEPLGLHNFIDSLVSRRSSVDKMGRVFRTIGNGIYQIEIAGKWTISNDSLIRISTPASVTLAIPVDYVSLSDKGLLTVVGLDGSRVGKDIEASEIPPNLFAEPVKISSLSQPIQDLRAVVKRADIVGVVGDGSNLQHIKFRVLSRAALQEGQLVRVYIEDKPVLYQIVNGITGSSAIEGDTIRFTTAEAEVVGYWEPATCHFESIGWVAESGSLVFLEDAKSIIDVTPIPTERAIVGCLPQSPYPIHVDIHEVVTHHSAILGITGSGKSVLAYELIRKMVENGIRVLVFDVSCDYAQDLADIPNLTKLARPADVHTFLASTSMLGIAEFQPTNTETLAQATASTVQAVLVWAKQNLQTQGFQQPKAKICVVFEEAHSLIPEWNSAGSPSDKDHVNRTSQAILQGRKYGVGALVITQRTANITKTILNQCNTIFALQSFDQTGLEFLKNYIGEGYANALSTLLKRQVVIFGKASSSRRPIIARLTEIALPAVQQPLVPIPAITPR